VTLGITLSHCVYVCCISLGGEGDALYPVLSSFCCSWNFCYSFTSLADQFLVLSFSYYSIQWIALFSSDLALLAYHQEGYLAGKIPFQSLQKWDLRCSAANWDYSGNCAWNDCIVYVINDRCSCKCCLFYDVWMVTARADSRRQIVSLCFHVARLCCCSVTVTVCILFPCSWICNKASATCLVMVTLCSILQMCMYTVWPSLQYLISSTVIGLLQ